MKKLISIMLVGLVITGCATSSRTSLALINNKEINTVLAQESAGQIKGTLPMASTTLVLNDTTIFGEALADNLRKEGFGVIQESDESVVNAVQLKYITDEITGEMGMYRVILDYDQRVFSRLYQLNDRSVVPLGAWSVLNATSSTQ